MTYASLAPLLRSLMMFWVMSLTLLYAFNTIRSIQVKRDKHYIILTSLCVVMFYFLYQVMIDIGDSIKDGTKVKYYIPTASLVLMLIMFTGFAIYQLISTNYWKKNNISRLSIKESFDSLPTALCFFLQSGLPRMTNKEMEKIYRALAGGELMDAGKFWLSLKYGDCKGCIIEGDDPIYRLPDGRIFCFSLKEMRVEKNKIYELIGNDITEEYGLKEELEEKRGKAREINSRLRELNKSITRITAEKEVLAAKVRIHNELGDLLLYSKSYLAGNSGIDKEKLLSMWKNNNRLFEESGPEVWQNTYSSAIEAARKLGVRVVTRGAMPEEPLIKEINETAIKVQVNNTLRHAHGHTVYADYGVEEGKYVIVFENDGDLPKEKIKEGGGLGNLRRMVEQAGGQLSLSHEPRFSMKVVVPKESEHNE